MDRKSVIVLIVSFVLILLWPKLMNELYPPPPKSTNTVDTATNLWPTNVSAPALSGTTNVTPSAPQIPDDAPEKLLAVTNESAIYTFTSRGGGIKLIQLRNYPQSIVCGETTVGEKLMASLNNHAPAPVFGWSGGGGENGAFKLTSSGDTVLAERTLTSGLVEIKEFQVSSNYLLNAKVRFENRSARPIVIPSHELVVGTATSVHTNDAPDTMGAFWFNGKKAEHIGEGWFANKTLGCLPGTPRDLYSAGNSNVVWAAVHNQFFALAVIPKESAPKMVSRQVKIPLPTSVFVNPGASPTGIQTSLAYPDLMLTANQMMERQYTIYAGPKEYNRLARIGDDFKNELDKLMNFGFFGFFAKTLLLSMNGLHAFGLTYGWAIVAITIIIKLLFWPLTNASTKSMKRMAALQPQMKAIADKYKDDPVKKNQKTMEFMKENKVSPLGGCLPMLLQIPVFFGFYTMLRSAIELRGADFLWACDLSQSDTIAHIGGFPINPMPLLMGITMLFQARLTPMSPSMDATQQKIMKYMPLMFIFILYKMSAGLTLYWTVQNLLTIVQMKLTKTDKSGAPTTPVAPVKSVRPMKKKKPSH